ncbi:hypothetical protein PAHAL_7G219000 [Panicum hallii]|uniref:Uncharacterized protein n=1 Tax=Panicum hallii TaxID=206008 RepID=A0A2T8ID25_9POAL|nr:hypothetical protein PAHAL_7G219000 [Panicum hallii]
MDFLSNTAAVPVDGTPWNPSSRRHERRGRCPCTFATKASSLVAVPYVVSGDGPAAGRRAGVRGLRPNRGVATARGGPGRGRDLAAGVPQGPGEGAGARWTTTACSAPPGSGRRGEGGERGSRRTSASRREAAAGGRALRLDGGRRRRRRGKRERSSRQTADFGGGDGDGSLVLANVLLLLHP